MKTLKEFLIKHEACEDGYEFAKDMTLEEFLEKCDRGDWIMWLFARTNPDSVRERTLAAGHCANTVRHLIKDKRIRDTVDAAIEFGEGKIAEEELDKAGNAAAWAAADAGVAADADADADYACAAEKENQKQTADICRKYLPIEIWNRSEI